MRGRRVPEKTDFWNLRKTVFPTSWRAKISDMTYICMYLDMVGGWKKIEMGCLVLKIIWMI